MGVAVVVVAADQATKSWAVHRLSRGPIHVVWKLDLELTYNSGAAFSFARGWAPVLGGLAVVAVLVLLGAVRRVQSTAIAVALGLVVGGALGNLVDRVREGVVTDFIKLPGWPAFNLADTAITLGVLTLFLLVGRGGAATRTA